MRHRLSTTLGVTCALLCIIAVLLYIVWTRHTSAPAQKDQIISHKEVLNIYVPAAASSLRKRVIEVRRSLGDKEKAEAILKELKRDKVITAGVQLQDIASGVDGVLYLDLSEELTDAQRGAPPEIMVVYSLVNSFLSSFKDVRQLQLLLDGEPAYTIAGTVYTYLPLEFNKELMED